MLSIVLVLHVALMSISLALSVITAVAATAGVHIAEKFNTSNVAITLTGIVLGVALLINHPIGIKCLMLSAYIVTFSGLQLYVRKRNLQTANN